MSVLLAILTHKPSVSFISLFFSSLMFSVPSYHDCSLQLISPLTLDNCPPGTCTSLVSVFGDGLFNLTVRISNAAVLGMRASHWVRSKLDRS